MSFSSCYSHSPLVFNKDIKLCRTVGQEKLNFPFSIRSNGVDLCTRRISRSRASLTGDWSFIGGSKIVIKPKATTSFRNPKRSQIHASWFVGSQLASTVFTWGTIAVLPYYTLMVFAPKSKLDIKLCRTIGQEKLNFPFSIRSNGVDLCTRRISRSRSGLSGDWSFIGGSKIVLKPKATTSFRNPKRSQIHASWFVGSQLASTVFTWGTIAVLPYYTLMVFAPKSELTKKSMESNLPYVVLGVLYAYLLFLSWTPETVRLIFASKYLLPELSSIGKMFSSELTLASAWIHLLVVDLFAARHIFRDGRENQIETRHSVSFCLFFCPIGILTHVITKAMSRTTRAESHGL